MCYKYNQNQSAKKDINIDRVKDEPELNATEDITETDDDSKPEIDKLVAVFVLIFLSLLIIPLICLFFVNNPVVRHILTVIIPGIAAKPGIKENLIEIFWSVFVVYMLIGIMAVLPAAIMFM